MGNDSESISRVRNTLCQRSNRNYNQHLANLFGIKEAVFLQGILDWYDHHHKQNQNVWFEYSLEYRKEILNCSDRKQRRLLKRLTEEKLIRTKVKGRGKNRKHLFKINFLKIDRLLMETTKVDRLSSLLLYNNNISNELKNDEIRSSMISLNTEKKKPSHTKQKKMTSAKERDKDYLPIAELLARIVKTNKNIKVNQKKLNSWARSIRKLKEQDGVTKKRMRKVLRWYKDYIGEEYIPEVESGGSFRSKFLKLESAMERVSGKKKRRKATDDEEVTNKHSNQFTKGVKYEEPF